MEQALSPDSSQGSVLPSEGSTGSLAKTIWRFAGVAWVCGVSLTLVGCMDGIETLTATSGASRTEGRIVAGRLPDGRWAVELPFPDPNARRSHKRGSGGGAVVRFEVDGQAYEIAARHRWFDASYSLGDRVQVVYHAARPEAGRIDSFRELWLFPTIGMVGLVVVVLGLAVGSLLVWRSMASEPTARQWLPASARKADPGTFADPQ